MAGESKTTTDHDEIRRWVEQRGGTPAAVNGTGSGNDPGILRIAYEGVGAEVGEGEDLEPLSWDEWFRAFDENELAFVYQDETKDGEESRFSKLVSREHAKH
jgi:hypothetical protein